MPEDRLLEDDSPWLPSSGPRLSSSTHPAARAAARVFTEAVARTDVRYRSPRMVASAAEAAAPDPGSDIAFLRLRFAPSYRIADSDGIYPELRERLVVNLFDALLTSGSTRVGR